MEVDVQVDNQLGSDEILTVFTVPETIMVPTRKFPHKFPKGLDHYLCSEVRDGGKADAQFKLRDQFRRYKRMTVGQAVTFCQPAHKQHGTKTFNVKHEGVHIVCYDVKRKDVRFRRKASNQFEKRRNFTAKRTSELCVPSLARSVSK